MRVISGCLFFFFALYVAGCTEEVQSAESQFNDPNLEAAIREAMGKPKGAIAEDDLQGITELEAPDNNIRDITGIERCVNLERLILGNWQTSNRIQDISPLSSLTNLKELTLSKNQIGDVTPLADLTNLAELSLSGNQAWDKKTDMPSPRWKLSTSVVDGKIYAIGGWTGNANGTVKSMSSAAMMVIASFRQCKCMIL
jgi:Leucine-rich repeat (LRR) protein